MSLKKILLIFLTALMLSSLVLTANAENTEIFKVGVEASSPTPVSSLPEIYNKGDEITVKLRANQNTGITSIKLLIDYDETLLEVVEGKYEATNLFTESDTLTSVVSTKGDGYFVFYSDNYPNVSENEGIFAEITFSVKDICADETAIEVSLFANAEGNCVKNTLSGVKAVPYEFEKTSFAIHGIDKSRGVVTPPTCTEDGYITYQCTDCKKFVVGNITPAKKHTESKSVQENIVAPTCTKAGSYDSVVYCSDCHAELSRVNKAIPVTEHKAAAAVEENRVEPTCTKAGSYDSVVYCTDCHAELTRENVVINALGHDLVHHDAKAYTCTEIGWDAYDTCSRCDYTTYNELSAIGHSFTNYVSNGDATCTEDGTKTAVCDREDCNETNTIADEGSKLGHSFTKYVSDKNATCTADGTKTAVCDRDGCNVTDTVKDVGSKLAHKYTNSCDTTCNDCGAKRTITHAYKTTTTKATLTKNGSITKKCSVCGKVASTTTIYYPKTVSIAATTYTYTGKVITPAVTVKNSKGTALKKGTDYTVTYASGRKNVGKYKVTVTFKGNYSGTKTFYFTINPVKTTVSKLTAGKKSIKVNITKKSTQVTGYQIQYSTSKTFKSAKTKTISSYKTTSTTLTKLTSKKTYYVRVRTYKTVGKTKYYSGWSTAKKVATKK